jgi:hypothetical protein
VTLGLASQGAGDPICRAAGHLRRAGPARGLAGDLGGLGRVGEEGKEEEEMLTSGTERSERERAGAVGPAGMGRRVRGRAGEAS